MNQAPPQTAPACSSARKFCPIKHAHKVPGTHARYARFLDYGDAADYHATLERFPTELATDAAPQPRNDSGRNA